MEYKIEDLLKILIIQGTELIDENGNEFIAQTDIQGTINYYNFYEGEIEFYFDDN